MLLSNRRGSEDSGASSSASLLDAEREGGLSEKHYHYTDEDSFELASFSQDASFLTKTRWRLASTMDTAATSLSHSIGTHVKTLHRHLLTTLLFLLPSFLTTKQSPTSPHAIAALDGLRGYASLGVFTLHFTDSFCQMHNQGWGFDENAHYLFQLPFVHYLWTADALVATFFVKSGYVLSHKPLRLIHEGAGADGKFLATMRSAIFRRGIRLYLPCVIATFSAMLLLRVGMFDYAHHVFAEGWTKGSEETPAKLASFSEQFWHWCRAMWDMTFLFRWGYNMNEYDPHLYTIPLEFQGSMLLFLVCVGVSRVGFIWRVLCEAGLVVYCGAVGHNQILLFFLGMLLADVDIALRSTPAATSSVSIGVAGTITAEADTKQQADTVTPDLVRRLRWLWLTLFIPGLYLAGMPQWSPSVTPGYITLMQWMPDWFRWQTIGCALLVWSVRNSPDLEWFFTNGFAQYLGNISFALYVVHGNVRRSLTYALIPGLMRVFAGSEVQEPDLQKGPFEAMVVVNTLVTYMVVFWAADLWWRAVDQPTIRFARRVEGVVSVNE